MILKILPVGPLQTNCYLLACEHTQEALVLDPGADPMAILDAIHALQVHVRRIVLTHYHFDHIQAAEAIRQATGASLAIHSAEVRLLAHPPVLMRAFAPDLKPLQADVAVQGGDEITVGNITGCILHTPGHSPGGITLWFTAEKMAFCGDTLFRDGLGRTDLPGGDHEALLRSIRERLLVLPEDTQLYPGHGPATSVARERPAYQRSVR